MTELTKALTFHDWTILKRNKAFWGVLAVMDILTTLGIGMETAYDGTLYILMLLAPAMGYEAAAMLLFSIGGKFSMEDFDVEEVDEIIRQSEHSMFAYMLARSMLYVILSIVLTLLPLAVIFTCGLASFHAIVSWQILFYLLSAVATAASGSLLITGFSGRSGMHASLLCLANQLPVWLFAASSFLLPQPWPAMILVVFMVATIYIAVHIDRKHHVNTLRTL